MAKKAARRFLKNFPFWGNSLRSFDFSVIIILCLRFFLSIRRYYLIFGGSEANENI